MLRYIEDLVRGCPFFGSFLWVSKEMNIIEIDLKLGVEILENRSSKRIEDRRCKKAQQNAGLFCGATRNRTKDTRIFSPLLYLLSYGTLCFKWTAKIKQKINFKSLFVNFEVIV